MAFCKEYNARTQDKAGFVIPVEISVFEDRSFTFITKTPPASVQITKAAGIANPKRIYVMRKQIQGIKTSRFLNLLESLIEIEVGLKKGALPADAFKDGLLKKQIL